jgi:hypothetical protein
LIQPLQLAPSLAVEFCQMLPSPPRIRTSVRLPVDEAAGLSRRWVVHHVVC